MMEIPVEEFTRLIDRQCGCCKEQLGPFGVCAYCYDALKEDICDTKRETIADMDAMASLVDRMADRIRDGVGDSVSWWQALRDVAVDLRTIGEEMLH